jgi:hypothetical protein
MQIAFVNCILHSSIPSESLLTLLVLFGSAATTIFSVTSVVFARMELTFGRPGQGLKQHSVQNEVEMQSHLQVRSEVWFVLSLS